MEKSINDKNYDYVKWKLLIHKCKLDYKIKDNLLKLK
ncbi:hypothetical protein CF088_01180 [Clostridium botulinum]|uniref:Uncharacterized protein n=2 Tax=Clostridium botulinum TaxID=1491 RepID=A5I5D2_CLOBH|nr:hypothetical protein CLB_2639 [Clostridium botulinum A str. ATCC 19397]ABS37821.1 hypothetical protein CLC_2571 [Clostridium botulinum A str. Hall]APH23352.1 hypothetical protein NPD1_99 [Clostridium botulinum]EKN36829.1 hypothetical protein CFSAN001627_26216 [Clostridium botulinum CFSAN001627]EPS50231.1 hypothetical protein CFSAN002369_08525 [Clostridium botulinum CFSAN002369]EPS55567.1 hypothetical protein CLQ_08623 [Clostridium botulinum Af84]CAL84259.1 hypothetical protein CBO2698 [Clo